MESALYVGKLRHRRFSPRLHAFSYPVYMVFLDIERLPELVRISPFAGYNRWNWTAYCKSDHFSDPREPLRERLARDAQLHGVTLPGGPIFCSLTCATSATPLTPYRSITAMAGRGPSN
jgi:uncharacterized protein